MKYFLAKELNSDDRDIVKYIEFDGFECGHYFSGLHLCGACFMGFEEEFRELVKNNFENIETIFTKKELEEMFELNDEIKNLGYGIEKGSERYNKGLELVKKFENTFIKKLASDENKKLFQKVIQDEKEFVKQEYNITNEEIEEIFNEYSGIYQDRAIIGYVFDDFDDMVEEEKWSMGYDKQPYFDDNAFGNDLLNSENYLELKSGKIISYSY